MERDKNRHWCMFRLHWMFLNDTSRLHIMNRKSAWLSTSLEDAFMGNVGSNVYGAWAIQSAAGRSPKTWKWVSILALLVPSSWMSMIFFFNGFSSFAQWHEFWRFCLFKKVVSNKCLNEITGVVWAIKCHHAEHSFCGGGMKSCDRWCSLSID